MTDPSTPRSEPGADPVAQLRRLGRHIAELSTAQLLELRDAAEACLARERLDAADAARLLATLG
jgi:hypothetical protein